MSVQIRFTAERVACQQARAQLEQRPRIELDPLSDWIDWGWDDDPAPEQDWSS